MTLDTSLHKTLLFQILKEIYSDVSIGPFLGFKGGTAAVFFYGLDRFSVDLDFDLLDDTQEDAVFERIIEILKKYGTLKESYKKRFNLFCLLSYEDKSHNIKIEISRRQLGSRYELKTYLGVSMLVMVREDMFAYKIIAMSERIEKTSRDIYDVWFFLKHRFPLNKDIVEKRSKKSFNEQLQKCIEQLSGVKDRNLLVGLGELLSVRQKDWARAKLKEETLSLLKLRFEGE